MTIGLPEGWATIRVGDYFQSWGGMTPPTSNATYWGGNVPWVSSKDIKAWRIAGGEEFITRKALQETRLRLCPVGSVLVVVRSGILAHTLPIAVVESPVLINQDLKAFYSPDGNLNEWLALALRALTPEILSNNRKDGTTVQSVRYEELRDLIIPVPPSTEQSRVTARVTELLQKVKDTRERLSRIPKFLKRFRQAALAAACSGRLTADWREKNLLPTDAASTDLIDLTATLDQLPEGIEFPQDWKLSTLDKLLTRVEAGKNIRCLEHPPGAEQKGIVKISAVSWGDFLEDESKTLEDPTLFMPERAIRADDLLISRANTIDLVGACVLVRDVKRTLMLSDKVLRLQVADKWKRWILICLRSPLGRFQIENLATGNQLSMRNITQNSLRRIVIPLLSPRERDEAVHRVERLLGLADAIEKRIVVATSRCSHLTQSILTKAFRGELVPTEAELARREGREYEPASVLLENIRKERESLPDIKRKQIGKSHPRNRTSSARGNGWSQSRSSG
jgi:type I restriction enzyme, S subunit